MRLSPQPSCHFDLPCVLFEDGQGSERVRQLARRRFLVATIDFERLVVAGFGQFHAACVPVEVTQVPNRVRKRQGVECFTTDGNRFLVQGSRRSVSLHVTFDLSERPQRLDQVALDASLSKERDRLQHEPPRIGESLLLSGAIRLPPELDRGVSHHGSWLASFDCLPNVLTIRGP